MTCRRRWTTSIAVSISRSRPSSVSTTSVSSLWKSLKNRRKHERPNCFSMRRSTRRPRLISPKAIPIQSKMNICHSWTAFSARRSIPPAPQIPFSRTNPPETSAATRGPSQCGSIRNGIRTLTIRSIPRTTIVSSPTIIRQKSAMVQAPSGSGHTATASVGIPAMFSIHIASPRRHSFPTAGIISS